MLLKRRLVFRRFSFVAANHNIVSLLTDNSYYLDNILDVLWKDIWLKLREDKQIVVSDIISASCLLILLI